MFAEALSLWKSGLLSSFDRLKHGVTVGRFDAGYSAQEFDEQVVSRRRRVCARFVITSTSRVGVTGRVPDDSDWWPP